MWIDEKAEVGRVREEKRRSKQIREEKESEERRCRCQSLCFSDDLCSGGSESRLAKAAGAEPSGQMRDEQLHAVVARSTCRSQNVQSTPFSEHFWQSTCRKSVRGCVAKHIWKSNVQNTSFSEHFWQSTCRKIARRCGAKHISKSKCKKHFSFGALLEAAMSKKCKPLWREAHFEVKMYKTHQLRTTFRSCDVEKVHAVVA